MLLLGVAWHPRRLLDKLHGVLRRCRRGCGVDLERPLQVVGVGLARLRQESVVLRRRCRGSSSGGGGARRCTGSVGCTA